MVYMVNVSQCLFTRVVEKLLAEFVYKIGLTTDLAVRLLTSSNDLYK